MSGKKLFLYASLWEEHGGAPGLGLYLFDVETGNIELIKKLSDTLSFNGSYIDQERGILYLCNETNVQPDVEYSTGRIYGFKLNKDTGEVQELFHRNTFCPNPCYINIVGGGKYMVVAHHGCSTHAPVFSTSIQQDEHGKYYPVMTFDDAVVQLYAMNSDGTLGELLDVRKHTSDIPLYNRLGRLTCCHPHSAVLSPSGNLIAVCDKGDSHIYLYKIDKENHKLVFLNKSITSVMGCGPRYCVFHPTKPYLYINHEFIFRGRLSVCAFRYSEDGDLERICDIDAVPADHQLQEGKFYQQQGFVMHPNGKQLYSIVNGLPSVAVFDINQETGAIELVQNAEIETGDWPRAAALSPDGRFLLIGCLSGFIKVFSVGADGKLSDTGFRGDLQGTSYFTFYDPEKTV